MKKLLLGSIALTLFSVSILLFQISCKKEVTAAQEPAGAETANQLMVFAKSFIRPTGMAQKEKEIWIANIDGTNPRKIPINIPSDLGFYDAHLTQNGKTIVFMAESKTNYRKRAIYSCSLDGTGFKKVLDFDNEYVDDTNYSNVILGSVN